MVKKCFFWNNSKNIDIWILCKEQNLFRNEFFLPQSEDSPETSLSRQDMLARVLTRPAVVNGLTPQSTRPAVFHHDKIKLTVANSLFQAVSKGNVNKVSHWSLHSWPFGKLPFNCQKIAKNWTFFSKTLTKIVIFFNKIANGNFVEKMTIFVNFFEKNVKFLAIFWQSNDNFPEGQIPPEVTIWPTN